MWTLFQFRGVVAKFSEAADPDTWDAVVERLALLMEYGRLAKMPISEPLGDGLFALRARSGTKQPRLLYYFQMGKRIVFVHAVDLKKRRNMDPEDIKLAKRNRALAEETGEIRAFTLSA